MRRVANFKEFNGLNGVGKQLAIIMHKYALINRESSMREAFCISIVLAAIFRSDTSRLAVNLC